MIYELAYRAPWLKIDQIITFGFIDTWHYLRQPVARFPDPYSPSSMSCSKIPLKGPVVDESDPQNPIVVPAEYGTYAKPPWVKTMHNFYSQDRSGAVDEGEIIEIAGAFNMEVTGSKHTTVDDELFDSGVPNVGWVVAKHLIETTLGR